VTLTFDLLTVQVLTRLNGAVLLPATKSEDPLDSFMMSYLSSLKHCDLDTQSTNLDMLTKVIVDPGNLVM